MLLAESPRSSAGEAVDLGKLIQRLHKERIEELKEDITKERTLVGYFILSTSLLK